MPGGFPVTITESFMGAGQGPPALAEGSQRPSPFRDDGPALPLSF